MIGPSGLLLVVPRLSAVPSLSSMDGGCKRVGKQLNLDVKNILGNVLEMHHRWEVLLLQSKKQYVSFVCAFQCGWGTGSSRNCT